MKALTSVSGVSVLAERARVRYIVVIYNLIVAEHSDMRDLVLLCNRVSL